jgi:hypothetical protein
LSALFLSKILSGSKNVGTVLNHVGSYECGFDGTEGNFKCAGGNDSAIALYFIIELAVVWLLFCCVSVLYCTSPQAVSFIQKFSFVTLFLVFASHNALFKKSLD